MFPRYVIGQSIYAAFKRTSGWQLFRKRRWEFEMSDATADYECPQSLLRNAVVCRIDHSRFCDVISRFAQHSASATGLHSTINRKETINIFNQKDFWPEMENNLYVAKKKIPQPRMMEACTFEILARFVESLVCRYAERLTRRATMEDSGEVLRDSELLQFANDLIRFRHVALREWRSDDILVPVSSQCLTKHRHYLYICNCPKPSTLKSNVKASRP